MTTQSICLAHFGHLIFLFATAGLMLMLVLMLKTHFASKEVCLVSQKINEMLKKVGYLLSKAKYFEYLTLPREGRKKIRGKKILSKILNIFDWGGIFLIMFYINIFTFQH